jgi:hypothetical protein
MVGSIMLIYIWEFRSYGSGGELCCRNSPLSPPRCLARGSDPLGASSPWDLAPESLSPTGQGLGTAAAPGMSATTDPRLRERHLRCPQCCGKLKCRPKPRPPAFPQHTLVRTDSWCIIHARIAHLFGGRDAALGPYKVCFDVARLFLLTQIAGISSTLEMYFHQA